MKNGVRRLPRDRGSGEMVIGDIETAKVAKFIKLREDQGGIRHSIKPGVIISDVAVKESGSPQGLRGGDTFSSEDDRRQSVKLMVSEWANGQVGEAIAEVQGQHVALRGGDALTPARNMKGAVIDNVAKVFQLKGRVDGLPLGHMGTLVKNGNDRPMLSLHDTTSINQGQIIHGVVVNAFHKDGWSVGNKVNDTHVTTSNATIGTTVN